METKRSKYIPAGPTVLCMLLICITPLKGGIMEPLRTGIGYFLIPIQTEANAVGIDIYDELEDYDSLRDALRGNEELKIQTVQLIEDNNRLQAEQFELDRSKKLYGLDQSYMQYDKIGAEVAARNPEEWFQVLRINKGSADGVVVDMNVVADGDLVGIVTDVGANYATVRSIIDDSSRVDAVKLDSSYNYVVAGDLTPYEEGRLKLTDLSKDAVPRDSDQIAISNISTEFLPGILVGYTADVSINSGHLAQLGYLTPVADFNSLQKMLIIMDIKDTGEAAVQ